uniref:Uncharacterized protein n=1 Tax=uncultured bacterium A1Q1_fos_1025 TaxID=1256537 RepID=L7VRL0_9BACT|nr:hypothetical protein [uncultured bacterium A1Q1_fos_1025]
MRALWLTVSGVRELLVPPAYRRLTHSGRRERSARRHPAPRMLSKVMWLAPPCGRIVREPQDPHRYRRLTHPAIREPQAPPQARSLTDTRHREPQGPHEDRRLTDHPAEPAGRPNHPVPPEHR